MQATAGSGRTVDGPGGLLRSGGRPGEAAETPGGAPERFQVEDFVHEPSRGRVGRVAVVHPPAPVLYGIRLADGKIGYAREHDLVAASDGQVREYRRAAHRWAAIRGSHGPQR